MNEHSLYESLYRDSAPRPDLTLIKLPGTQYQQHLPDCVLAWGGGNFFIEFKAVELPKRRDTTFDPWNLCTPGQQHTLTVLWNINGMAAVAVGFELGAFKHLAVFTPEEAQQPWRLYDNLAHWPSKRRGHAWDFDKLCEILAYNCRRRFGTA